MAKYDKDVDYQALINEAAAKKDYKAAAQYEQQRNAKINDLNATGDNKYNATATNSYAGWLDDTDYGTIGKQQMASGASWQDVANTYENRLNKSANTVGLTQYANDDLQQQMLDYIIAGKGAESAAGYSMPTFSYDVAQPTFNSNYQTRIDAMLNDILNREKFSYNVEDDQLYQQYKTQYNREGNRAMNDALAAAASGAGGMNSYAMTAAQQANNYYATQLGDKIPELYQLAYDMYLTDIDQQVRDLGLLQDMDNTQYNRYRDTMSDWRNDRDFAYGMYRDNMGDYQWGKQFDYNASQDAIDNAFRQEQADIGNNQWQIQHDFNVTQAGIDNKYRQDQADIANAANKDSAAWNKAMDLLNSGTMPTADQLNDAGMTNEQASAILALVKAGYNMDLYGNPTGYVPPKTGGDNGGNGGTDGNDDTGKDDNDDDNGGGGGGDEPTEVENRHADSWVHVQGFGRLTWQELEHKVNTGEIIETITSDGKYRYEKNKLYISYK